MKPVVSIIVPVYNAETVLSRCIDSILQQEYTNFELILINDGSQDRSGEICEQYRAKDSRIKVLHKKNSGVSDSRNHGFAVACGTYVQFLDSDDWITPNATMLMVRAAQEHDCDLVISDFYRVVGERVSVKGSIDDDRVMTREQYASYMMKSPADFYYGVLWNKLYRRDIIESHHLRMNENISWCEDFMFNLEYIRYAESFYALPVPIYYYVKTKGSLVNKNMSLSRVIKMKLTVFEYYTQFYQSVLDEEEYERSRLKVYRFLIDGANDAAVPPLVMPGTKRLGKEGVQLDAALLEGRGIQSEIYRTHKLLEYYLEPVALKYDLSLQETMVLFNLTQVSKECTLEMLADYTDQSRTGLMRILQKFSAREYLTVEEVSPNFPGESRKHQMSFLPTAQPILADLYTAQNDVEQAVYAGFSEEELTLYLHFRERMKDNILRIFPERAGAMTNYMLREKYQDG